MKSNNLERGFHRVGLVLAIPLALAGMAMFVGGAFNTREPTSFFGTGAALLVAAGIVYAACWAVGWIVRGFMKDPDAE